MSETRACEAYTHAPRPDVRHIVHARNDDRLACALGGTFTATRRNLLTVKVASLKLGPTSQS